MILYQQWRELPLQIRNKIAIQFQIGKTKPIHVSNNEVVDDGYEIKNIESQLTVPNLQTYLASSETDLTKLWLELVDRMTGRTRVAEPTGAVAIPEVVEPALVEVVHLEGGGIIANGVAIGGEIKEVKPKKEKKVKVIKVKKIKGTKKTGNAK